MNLHEFLTTPLAHLAPDKILEGLESADAERRVPGVNHSVAEVVAHMAFWQDWFYAPCTGHVADMVASAAQGWPAVADGSWPEIQTRFVERLRQLDALAATDVMQPVTPPIDFPPLAHYTVQEALVHVATHNSHHLGQVVLLRQLLGAWPPPAGSWTW